MGKKDYLLLVVFSCSLLSGIAFPEASAIVTDSLKYLLMGLLFLSFLKISLADVIDALRRNWSGMISGTVLRLVLAPALAYGVTAALYPPMALPVLLLAGVSTGVSAPFFTAVCRGNISYTLVMAMVTTMLLPFSLPLMVRVLSDASLNYDLTAMGLFLAMIIFVPLGASGLLKTMAPRLVQPLNRYSYPLSLIVIAAINFGALGRYVPYLQANPQQIVIAFICALLVALVYGALGWVAIRTHNLADRIAASGSQVWVNNMLIVALAVHIDQPLAATLGILYLIPFYGFVFVFTGVAERADILEAKASAPRQ